MRGSPLATKSYGAPDASISCARSTSTSLSSSRRLPTSNDWMNTGPRRRPARCGAAPRQRLLQRQADRGEVGRVLGLGVDADHPAAASDSRPARSMISWKRRDLVAAVVGGVVGPQLGEPLLGPQRLQLGEGEVLGEPAGDRDAVDGLGGPAGGELGVVGDVGGTGDLVLVPGDQHAVLGGDQVGLDVVGALSDRQPVGLEGVLRPVAAGAAVGDDDRPVGAVARFAGFGRRDAARCGRPRWPRQRWPRTSG